MALDESTEGLERIDSNGIAAYINPDFYRSVSQRGNIYIDHGSDRFGGVGYSISVKKSQSDKNSCC